jgi:hypothetical protein
MKREAGRQVSKGDRELFLGLGNGEDGGGESFIVQFELHTLYFVTVVRKQQPLLSEGVSQPP